MSASLDERYQKTEAGRAEIKARSLTTLSRSGRNLLLMLDSSRTAREWLAMVQGATEADVVLLLAQGLIAGPAVPVAALGVDGAVAAPGVPAPALLGYTELYSYLTGHARQYLGLIKGYRTVLDVERCADLAALQDLAERFANDVEREHGQVVAQQVRQSLGLKP